MELVKTMPIIVETGKHKFHVSRNVRVFHRATQLILAPESKRKVVAEFKSKGYSKPMVKIDMAKIKLRGV